MILEIVLGIVMLVGAVVVWDWLIGPLLVLAALAHFGLAWVNSQ